jgi:hypothetical protein
MSPRLPAALGVALLALGATAADASSPDFTPPRLAHLHAAGGVTCPPPPFVGCTARPAVITFTLSEKASVFLQFVRAPRSPREQPELFTAREHAFPGRNTIRAHLTQSGHYRLAIIATDGHRNVGRPGRTHFTQHL